MKPEITNSPCPWRGAVAKQNPGVVVMTQPNPNADPYQLRGRGPWAACETTLDKILK